MKYLLSAVDRALLNYLLSAVARVLKKYLLSAVYKVLMKYLLLHLIHIYKGMRVFNWFIFIIVG